MLAKRRRQWRFITEIRVRYHHRQDGSNSKIAEERDEQREHDAQWNISTRIDCFFAGRGNYIEPDKTEKAASGSGKYSRRSVRSEIFPGRPVPGVYMPQTDTDYEDDDG